MAGKNNGIIKGIFWTGLQLVVNQSFSFVIRLLLARILFPEEFGLIGMATVFIGFIQVLNDLGMEAAIVQRKSEKLTESHFHTAFWTGLIWGGLLYATMCFAVAPLAAEFYNESILKNLIPVLSINILSSPINMMNRAQLTRAMDFRKIAIVENTSNIIAGTLALVLAWFGAGVWSLAFNSVCAFLITVPLYFRMTNWRPRLIWKRACFKDIFGFGVYTTGTNIVNFLVNNFDFMLIGKLLSPASLGAYSFAFVLTDTFRGRLMSVINKVMYPFYGKRQDDPASLKHYYLKVVEYNSIIIYPIMVFFCVLGEPFILQFFGDKWGDSIVPLKILSISVMFHLMVNSNTALIRGMGKPELELKLQFFKAFIFVPSIYIGIHYNGIIGAAYAVLANKILAVIIAQYTFNYLLRLKVSTNEFLRSLKAPLLSSLVAFIIGYICFEILSWNSIVVAFLLFSSYFLTCWNFIDWVEKEKIRGYIYRS